MKAGRLILSERERIRALHGMALVDGENFIARAQAAKVLAVLLREAKRTEATTYAQDFLARVIKEIDMTWPVKAKGR